MILATASRSLLAAVLWLGATSVVMAATPGEWLERMTTAMEQMSYQGTFPSIMDR